MANKRKKLLVHKQIQRLLLRRSVFYFLTCFLFILLPATLLRTAMEPQKLLTQHAIDVMVDFAPIFLSVLVLMPFALFDMLKISNRIVGPIIRLRNEMERLSTGEAVDPIVLREQDYWHDVASVFNDLLHENSVGKTSNTPQDATA